jgi:hypothetical protein
VQLGTLFLRAFARLAVIIHGVLASITSFGSNLPIELILSFWRGWAIHIVLFEILITECVPRAANILQLLEPLATIA